MNRNRMFPDTRPGHWGLIALTLAVALAASGFINRV